RRPGPRGKIPFTPEDLTERPSGDHFGQIQNVGMGWAPEKLTGKQYLILSTHGGLAENGRPIALGYHTGHFEVNLAVKAAAETVKSAGCIPFAGYCSDPCDGRTQGTQGMYDSLPYRNDAAIVFRRLIRSLPTRHGVLGVATCDKGLPAMLMALASMHNLPCVLIPGGVTLPPKDGEDLGKIQSIGARYAQGEVTLEYAREASCGSCASPGGGCHFFGTAASSQAAAESLGLSLPHSALAPSGQEIWLDMARRSAEALMQLSLKSGDIVTGKSIQNAMAVNAAFGGSTNMLLHIPAIAHAAGLDMPTLQDWIDINKKVPRLVDVLPNGPHNYPTLFAFLAGGVPEVMLHLRELGYLHLDVLTVTGRPLEKNLKWWESCDRRKILKDKLFAEINIDPADVIMNPSHAAAKGLANSTTFPTGNLAPQGSVIKSTSIDPDVLDDDGVYRNTGRAKVFTSERAAIRTLKQGSIKPGDIIVLICTGPLGSGMEETFQITSALKYLSWGKHVAVITDGRFSGVSTGACIGHVGPEALAGGPVGKVLDGDYIRIIIDTRQMTGTVDLVGAKETPQEQLNMETGNTLLKNRRPRPDLQPQPDLPMDTKLWAALQNAGGGTWSGCVYDAEKIIKRLIKIE
ncbi:YjhG/YagF family D-xylonate dehydratase, partial [candidate division KSB1 bacterium]|nr:YjhG/YagF family D-xylonate dehydratase [candidate division KSB1 bacterium]